MMMTVSMSLPDLQNVNAVMPVITHATHPIVLPIKQGFRLL